MDPETGSKKVLEETAGKKKDLERRHIEDLLTLVENGTGKRISLPYNMVAEKNYQYIKVQKGNMSDKQEMTGKILCEEVTDLTNIVENDCIKIIDYDRIETGVQLRCRKPGDFFTFGKDQKRKIIKQVFLLMRRFQDNCGKRYPWWQMAVILYGSLAEESANIIRSKNQPSVI